MRTYQAQTNRFDDGFTLLEMVVVIAIVTMVLAAAPTIYARLVPSFQVRQFANDVAYHIRSSRERARAFGKTQSLRFNAGDKRLLLTDMHIEVPTQLDVVYVPEELWSQGGVNELRMFPNGGSSGGKIIISRNNLEITINIDWMSGSVEVEQ